MGKAGKLALLSCTAGVFLLLIGVRLQSTPRALASPSLAVKTMGAMWLRLDARCEAFAREPLAPYPWPLAPFNREHPVRGYFGDPRTVFSEGREAALSFHNGIDIAAWRGNRVYPVVSGTVIDVDGDRVILQATAHRRFQYIHLSPTVRVDEHVVASRTVLGTVPPRWSHIHLTEIRSGCAVNPLARGHLTPFRDTTEPLIQAIRFEDPSGRLVSPSALAGKVRIVVSAHDESALPAPGQWRRMPVAPALLTWELETGEGSVVLRGIGADFRYSEPAASAFCFVYAPGTVQNFAAVGDVYRWARPGRFLFDLTPHPLDTSRLHAGLYLLVITAGNLGGHTATRTEPITVGKGRLLTHAPIQRDRRCQ